MLIQCLIPRRTGTPVTLGDGTKIVFKPNEQDDHVADVKDKAHIKQLLGHKGVYRPYNAEESALEKEEAEAERLRKAQEADSNMEKKPPAPEPVKVEGEGGGNEGDENTGAGNPDTAMTAESLNAMDETALRDLFEKVVGKKPHHKVAKDKIVLALLAHQENKQEPGNE